MMKEWKFYCKFRMSLTGFILFYSSAALAQSALDNIGTQGFGDIAAELSQDPLRWTMRFFYGACYVIGGIILWKAYESYKFHKGCPEYADLYTPIFLLIAGLVAICIPLAHYIFTP